MDRIAALFQRLGLKALPTASKRVSGDPSYKCPICRDIGLLLVRHYKADGEWDGYKDVPCECQKERVERERVQRLLKFCQLPPMTEHMTLANFQANESKPLAEALGLAEELADEKGGVRWLTLLGDVDRGKTHLAIAICRRWLERGRPAKYAFVPILLQELRNGFELDGEFSYRRRLDLLCNVPLLVLDDMGVRGKLTDWSLEQLQTIVHYRGISALPLVVTSNRPLDEICGTDSEDARLASKRISSRLQRESFCRVINMRAAEHRLSNRR